MVIVLLEKEEIVLLLDALRDKYGSGWSDDPKVRGVQTSLSLSLQLASQTERGEVE